MTPAASANQPRVAVVMCTYNGERFVAEQIASVLEQSRPPDQLVIVDDASTDATWSILQRHRATAMAAGIDVIVRRNEVNLGYVANFDYALSLADSDLVFLCDQDDIWYAHKIERMTREFIRRPDLTFLHTDARLVGATGSSLNCGLFEALEITTEELSREHAGHAFEVLLRRNLVTGATTAVRLEAVRRASPFPPNWVHDEWIAMSCAMSGLVDCLEEPLIDYRQHGSNQIGVRRPGIRDRLRPRISRRALMRTIEQRLEALLCAVRRHGPAVNPAHEAALNDRLRHARVRAHLPESWGARTLKVMDEVRVGGYTRYSFGLRSIIADLLGLE